MRRELSLGADLATERGHPGLRRRAAPLREDTLGGAGGVPRSLPADVARRMDRLCAGFRRAYLAAHSGGTDARDAAPRRGALQAVGGRDEGIPRGVRTARRRRARPHREFAHGRHGRPRRLARRRPHARGRALDGRRPISAPVVASARGARAPHLRARRAGAAQAIGPVEESRKGATGPASARADRPAACGPTLHQLGLAVGRRGGVARSRRGSDDGRGRPSRTRGAVQGLRPDWPGAPSLPDRAVSAVCSALFTDRSGATNAGGRGTAPSRRPTPTRCGRCRSGRGSTARLALGRDAPGEAVSIPDVVSPARAVDLHADHTRHGPSHRRRAGAPPRRCAPD